MYQNQESKESAFLKQNFGEYYLKNFIDSVPEIEKREFGYGVFGRKIANRNMAFCSVKEMNDFLRLSKPLFISYSNAYYKYPDRKPMDAKELLRADIIYEFDADEIETGCKEKHDYWVCKNGHSSFGHAEKCPECGSTVEIKQWFCEECIGAAAKNVFKLVDFLENDFGFNPDELEVNFSGKAGYHVHFRSKEIQQLNRKARIELVDYLMGAGLFFEKIGFNLDSKNMTCPLPNSKGRWGRRLVEGIKSFFELDVKTAAKITGLPVAKIKPLFEEKTALFKSMEKGILFSVKSRKNKEFWEEILKYSAAKSSVPIDRQTSIDLHKIIRVPETLHGDTGLLAKKVSLKDLGRFNPFNDAVVFGDVKVRVFIKKAPRFILNGREFGPFENEEAEVPLYCAVYLVGKGAVLK